MLDQPFDLQLYPLSPSLHQDGIAGGHHNPVLRKWWRGCIGLTKQQQAEVYATPAATEEDFEDDSDEQDNDSDDDESIFQVGPGTNHVMP